MTGVETSHSSTARYEDDDLVVDMQGIVKRFGDVVANDDVHFELRGGEIHALLGENGAGKTTLMNILYGLIPPDEGTIHVRGHPVRIRSSQDAIALGIGMVHQHFMLVPTLTVAENMILGEKGSLSLTKADLRVVKDRVDELGGRYGLSVPAGAYVWQLSVGEQQRVEILRALYRNAQILILDEPTATLAPNEVEHVLDKLQAMARDGASIVIITHHLDEVMACADRITVLRKGRHVATVLPADTSTGDLARLMVGRDVSLARFVVEQAEGRIQLEESESTRATGGRRKLLEVQGLSAVSDRGTEAIRDVSIEVAEGEIVAIAGVEGNGQSELEEVLCGLRPPVRGTIRLQGSDVTGARPSALLRGGVGFIPSDRYRRGLIRQLSVAENLVLDRIDRRPFGSRFLLRPKAILANANRLIRDFAITVSRPSQPAGKLSGGNTQRVVLARVFTGTPRLLLAAQPTRGLDVGAIEFVWDQLRARRKAGVGILLISTDLEEVMALADRCYVMYKGQLVSGWTRSELDREAVGLAMGGVLGAEQSSPSEGRG
ncbi:MAG: ABC transporter ATP-binding protein [Actinomycetota bacterium]